MIKWYCFDRSISQASIRTEVKNYIPNEMRHLVASSRVVITVMIGRDRISTDRSFYVYGVNSDIIHFDNARDAFEAGEEAFALNYPELYLQSILNEDRRSC